MNPDLLLQIQPPPKSDFDSFKQRKEADNTHKHTEHDNVHKNRKAAQKDVNKQEDDPENSTNFSDVMARLRQNRADDVQAQNDLTALHFHTQSQTTLEIAKDAQDSALSPDQILSANITALNVEIARLLEDIRENGDLPQDTLIATAAQQQGEDNEGVLKLLSFMLGTLDPEALDEQQGDTENLVSLLEELKTLLGENEEQLIASGLSVEDLTALQKDLQRLMEEETGFANLQLLNSLQAKLMNPEQNSKADDAARQVIFFAPDHLKAERYELRYQLSALTSGAESPGEDGYDFQSLLKGTQGADILGAARSGQAAAQQQGASPLPAWMVWGGSETFALGGLDNLSFTLNQSGLGAGNPAQALQAGLTSLITQAPAAGQTHPATQMVAATIQKAVKAGDDTKIKLQLDPPELGRVEVKMSIGKDNAAKIVLTAEKPETYMMLQRDAQALERALQDAGIESDGSLSFELAQQDQDFGQDNRRGGGHDQGGTGTEADAELEELIETTMTWRVDPETGHMRYNILA